MKRRVRRLVLIVAAAAALTGGGFGAHAPAIAGSVCAGGHVNGIGAAPCVPVTPGGTDCADATYTGNGLVVSVLACNPNDVP